MIHVTVAIADFMTMLVTSALWAAASASGAALAGIGAIGGTAYACRRALRRRKGG